MTKEKSDTKYIDRLLEDEPITDQAWVCLSFLSPEMVRNCNIRGLKIRGVYPSKEEADKRAKELQHIDPDFHVFVGEVGKWLPWDPDPNDVKDQHYYEKELQKLMEGYKDNLEKSKKMHHQHKQDMLKQAAQQEIKKEEKTKARLRKKLEAKKQQKKIDSIVNRQFDDEDDEPINDQIKLTEKEEELVVKEKEIKESEELIKSERLRLNETEKQINEKTQNLETIDSKLSKIQALYDKLNKEKKAPNKA